MLEVQGFPMPLRMINEYVIVLAFAELGVWWERWMSKQKIITPGDK